MFGYGDILVPAGVDENGDVIYKYNRSDKSCQKKQNDLAGTEVVRD